MPSSEIRLPTRDRRGGIAGTEKFSNGFEEVDGERAERGADVPLSAEVGAEVGLVIDEMDRRGVDDREGGMSIPIGKSAMMA